MPAPRFVSDFFQKWGFRIGIALFVAVGIGSFLSLTSAARTNQWVNRTNEILNQLSELRATMENAESSQFGYVVSDKAIFQSSFQNAMEKIPNQLNSLVNLESDNPTQISNALELRKIIEVRLDKMKNLIRMHTENVPASEIANETDVDIMADVRTRIARMEMVESQLLNQRLAKSERQTEHTKLLIIFGGIIAAIMLYYNHLLQQQARERELRRSHLLDMIVQGVGDGLVVVDEHNRFTHYNPAAEKLLGGAKTKVSHELRPQEYGMFDPKTGEYMLPERMPLHRALKGEKSDDFEFLVRNAQHPTGVVVSANARPLRGSNNKIVGAVAVLRDLTRRKQMEYALETEKLRALQASQLKSEALASMSHEIRTPMNGVLGMVTLLLDTTLDAAQKSYAMTIKSSAEALLSLINGILDHAKIEAGKLTLDNFDFHLPTLAGDVTEMFRYQARSKRLELVSEVTPAAAEWFHGDANRIRQILINLIGNAFKFTEQGRISIKVDAVVKNSLERELRFEVSDTGIGVSPDNQKKLFQKFSQVHNDRARYGGTGLGLLLCKQFANLMGGEIGIDSSEGAGSKFWFTVKVAPGMRQQKPRDTKTAQAPATVLNGHVLVVEDQPVNRQVVKSYLEKLGVTCDIHHDGRQGLDAFMSDPARFDLILMDVQMPVMDGFQCSREIRKFEESRVIPHVPIVALTAEGRSHDRENCLAAGMDDFLSKPIDMTQFTDTLKKWLRPKMAKVDTEENLVAWKSLEKLSELKADGRPLDVALVEEFLRTSSMMVGNLEEALRIQDQQQIKEIAHAIKSPARTIGLMILGDLCESIEDGQIDAQTSRRLGELHHRSALELRGYLRRRSSQAA